MQDFDIISYKPTNLSNENTVYEIVWSRMFDKTQLLCTYMYTFYQTAKQDQKFYEYISRSQR